MLDEYEKWMEKEERRKHYLEKAREWKRNNKERVKNYKNEYNKRRPEVKIKCDSNYREKQKIQNPLEWKKRTSAYNKKYRTKNREKILQREREKRILYPERAKIYSKRWRLNNPETYSNMKRRWHKQIRARDIANRKIKITEKDKCEMCNSKEQLERHHMDYSKPLYVKILCHKCHKQITFLKRGD